MKTVKEIHLSVQNQPGTLSTITDLLGADGIRIVAFHVAASGKKGKLRFVADDPEKALGALKTAGYSGKTNDVLACEVPSHAGGLAAVLKPFKASKIDLDTIYPCIGTGETTILILAPKSLPEAHKVLEDNWIRLLGEELYQF
jgi:hypothetical protein